MKRFVEDITVESNVWIRLTERGKYVTGSLREGHNVFTTTGRDWLAHLCAWQSLGTPDIPFTQRRVRWCAVGTGSQPEVVGVTQLAVPTPATHGIYLSAVQTADFPAIQQVTFYKEFAEAEISLPDDGLAVVPVTEAGLFVDVFPVSTAGGTEDAANGAFDTTLNPASAFNSPITYKTFDVVNKTIDFKLEIQWSFRFG